MNKPFENPVSEAKNKGTAEAEKEIKNVICRVLDGKEIFCATASMKILRSSMASVEMKQPTVEVTASVADASERIPLYSLKVKKTVTVRRIFIGQ